jgi:hypothetical protein
MKVKRLLGSLAAAGTLTALAIGTAAPAFAAPHISFVFNPTDQAQLPGSLDPHSIAVSVQATSDCQLLCQMAGLTFTIKDPDGNVVASGSAGQTTSTNVISASATWDTQPTARKNGNYVFAASATEGGAFPPPGETQQATLRVNNLPAAPASVAVALDPTNTPVVTWRANTEPDLKGYQVYRSDTGATPLGGLITTTSFRDTSAPKDQALSYKVAALRSDGGSGFTSSSTSDQTAPITVPAPAAAGPAIPQNVATVDPPPTPKAVPGANATAPSSVNRQALNFSANKPAPITGPNLPTQVVQLPQPNVVQFAPLLPYSGKIPEVPVTSNVPTPVAAQPDSGQAASIALPGGVKVTPVDAVKYVATAAFLIVAAVHITRFARRLKNAPV